MNEDVLAGIDVWVGARVHDEFSRHEVAFGNGVCDDGLGCLA